MTIYNFSAGPATLPKPVLEKAQAELLNYQDSGMSVLEMSHRSPEFDKIVKDAEATLRELMAIPDNYKVIFLQGGASTQFTMVPLNLAQGKKAYYLVGGSWGKKAYTEAVKLSKTIPFEPILLASSEETVYDHIPSFDPATIDPEAAYVHLTTNNTIEGTSIYDLPDTNGVPIVADMSSNILAARYNVEDFALIYAGAQKNIGPAGVTVVIVREDFLNDQPQLSAMLDYRIQAEAGSLYNTPPCFNIYISKLVFDWIKNEIGGVDKMAEIQREKSGLLYDYIESSDFYTNPVKDAKDRSVCNIPFVTPSKELDAKFVAEADALGFKNIKGHRSVGGMRASVYNAFPRQGVLDLIDFMKKFEAENKSLGKEMEIRQAFPNEIGAIMTVIESARTALAEAGSTQWQGADGYPTEETIFDDVLNGQAYVGIVDGQIVSYAAVIVDGDPAYDKIYDGDWKHHNKRYITFHRIAVLSEFTGQGIAQTFIQGLIEGTDAHDFRCDTHEKNTVMQHILEKLGYVYCGKVPIDGERLAYQKIKTKREKAFYQELDEAAHHGIH